MTDRLLTVAEAAHELRTPPNALAYWRHVRTGPRSAKIGRRIVYRESDLRAWVDQQFAESAAGRGPHA